MTFSSGDAVPPGMEVFRLDFDLGQDGSSHEHGELSPQEHKRAARFAKAADRIRFTGTRVALRRLLAEHLGCAPAEVVFEEGTHGKPFVPRTIDQPEAPVFNASHSGGHALIALADPAFAIEIGVDIERITADEELLLLANTVFTPRECAAIKISADPMAAFFLHWTAKEALLKAAGVGITEHLQTVGLLPTHRHSLEISTTMNEWRAIQTSVLDAPRGYAAALAWRPTITDEC